LCRSPFGLWPQISEIAKKAWEAKPKGRRKYPGFNGCRTAIGRARGGRTQGMDATRPPFCRPWRKRHCGTPIFRLLALLAGVGLIDWLVNYFHAGVVKKSHAQVVPCPEAIPSGQARASTSQAGRQAGRQATFSRKKRHHSRHSKPGVTPPTFSFPHPPPTSWRHRPRTPMPTPKKTKPES